MKSKMSHLTCKRVAKLVARYLNHELEAKLQTAFEQHIGDCEDCVGFVNTYRQTVEATRALRCEDLPPDLQQWALEFLRQKIK